MPKIFLYTNQIISPIVKHAKASVMASKDFPVMLLRPYILVASRPEMVAKIGKSKNND